MYMSLVVFNSLYAGAGAHCAEATTPVSGRGGAAEERTNDREEERWVILHRNYIARRLHMSQVVQGDYSDSDNWMARSREQSPG
jgi:hypothetical protein